MSINPANRTYIGGYISPNRTMFNLNDAVPVSGYLRSVSVQFHSRKLPSANAKIWIYTISPILGSFIVCSQCTILFSQISQISINQTYTILSIYHMVLAVRFAYKLLQ